MEVIDMRILSLFGKAPRDMAPGVRRGASREALHGGVEDRPHRPQAGEPSFLASRRGDAVVTGVVALGAMAVFSKISPGRALKLTFVPAMGIAYGCHLLTTNRATPDPERVLPLYLLALATQFLHLTEEFSTEFYRRWPEEIFDAPAMSPKTHVAINMVSYAAFTLGAVGLYRRIKAAMVIVWFFTLMGVVGNAIQHPLYAAKVRGYFPGLYTSVVYWLFGPALVRRLWATRQSMSA
jgi:hypothetical protein